MVAISLYRGNLHRVSDVPRRWLPPKRQISLKDFKTLLARRARALSRLNSSESNPTPISVPDHQDEPPRIKLEFETVPEAKKEVSADCCKEHTGERKSEEDLKFEVITEKPIVESDSKPEFLEGVSDRADNVKTPLVVVEAQAIKELAKPDPEVVKKEELDIEKVKRKKEVEERLKVLNDKKHGLVQLLKQVLNAEEELKRRNSTLGVSNRPQALLQVEVNNDSVSMTRNLTPEGNEGDDLSNHNLHSRRMNSMSPSSESPIRRLSYLQHNTGLHPVSRTSLGATGSPSRFTPTGNTANMPTSSVSGTNYVASSPSPVASGGTSTFRDSRFPSPWN